MAAVRPHASQLPGTPLAELAAALEGELVGDGGLLVRGVRQDSRAVEPGDLFVALAGARADGARFAGDAMGRGAVAVLLERGKRLDLDVPRLYVGEPRRALARAAALIYGRPTEALGVVGITGTNGKTTSAHLVAAALAGAGCSAAVMGTLGVRFGTLSLPPTLTSPEADVVQRVAAEVLAQGATHLVMEVSSIALEARRVDEVRFSVAAFTNLSQDHLDYHGSMERYAAAKARLFLEHAPAASVVTIDDPFGRELARRIERAGASRLVRVGRDHAEAEVRLERVERRPDGIRLTARLGSREVSLASPMVGDHNVSNLLTALAVADALGIDPAAAAAGLAEAAVVPGRLERVSDPARDDVLAVVDYAHTPDALARVLDSVRPAAGRLWCVFGCGGDRDPHKRAPMGAAVASRADVAIVSNDNPRSEDPVRIAEQVTAGAAASGSAELLVELDRARAIDLAVSRAAPGDVVVVAGKGHETYQIIGERVIAFDDRAELRRALARRRGDS